MDRNDIATMVRHQVGDILNRPADFASSDLLADHGLDSLTSIQLTLALEDEFQLAFADDEISLEHFETIDSIVNLLDKKLQA
ncbi:MULTISPECIES: acyl carrier protein [Streptomyces]|uniref:acyl carrier protein n=1 Tax=Streptomyces TaxID=1883 RepID=UPI00141F4EBE|nr:phosphopantetheine-binding protein [Streptomyces sp. MBT27]